GASDPGLARANDDVGLEARDNIYVTETNAYLRLVLAHATLGDIRLTVRESALRDEDLYLVKNGSARFAESNTRAPSGNDIDAPRILPNGQVFAESGKVTLRVGDDVATHQNSEILADLSIDLFGDYLDLDAGYGTNMILRGRTVADCVVSLGQTTGDPEGTCTPTTANPVAGRITQIWGNNDIDTFQLGDPSGLDLLNTKITGRPGLHLPGLEDD